LFAATAGTALLYLQVAGSAAALQQPLLPISSRSAPAVAKAAAKALAQLLLTSCHHLQQRAAAAPPHQQGPWPTAKPTASQQQWTPQA
jgi:hypothetical protein